MRSVKIGELRDHLSRYLAAARRGERVIVLDRRTPIAEIGPITARGTDDDADRAELVRLGLLVPGRRTRGRRRPLPTPIPCRGDMQKALRAERDAN